MDQEVPQGLVSPSFATLPKERATPVPDELLLGLLFAPIAAAMAFFIFYEEYAHHRLSGRRLWAECLGVAAVAFAVFLLAPLLVSLMVPAR